MLALHLLFLLPLMGKAGQAQQCYFDRGMRAPSGVVPCFPANINQGEASACCQAGDFCLTDGACFDPRTETTYMYGCTDDTYSHSNCPAKCDLDTDKSPWVGMVKCHNESVPEPDRDDPPYTWACNHPDTCRGSRCPNLETWGPTIFAQPSKPNGCDDLDSTATALVVMSWVLSGLHSLPTSVPGSATPTTARSASAAETESAISGSGTPSEAGAVGGTPSPTDAPVSEVEDDDEEGESERADGPDEGLSNGTAIGIGFGVGIAALLAAIVAFFVFRRRRRRKQQAEKAAAAAATATAADGKAPLPMQMQVPDYNYSQYRPYDASDFPLSRYALSELPDEGTASRDRPVSELAASSTAGISPVPTTSGGTGGSPWLGQGGSFTVSPNTNAEPQGFSPSEARWQGQGQGLDTGPVPDHLEVHRLAGEDAPSQSQASAQESAGGHAPSQAPKWPLTQRVIPTSEKPMS